MTAALTALLVAGGTALLVAGVLLRGRERQRALEEILDLPWGERDVPVEAIESRAALATTAVGLASRVVEQFDAKGTLRKALERARLPLRPEEFVVVMACGTFGTAVFLWLVTKQWWFVVLSVVLSPLFASAFLNYRVKRRQKQFEAQLPDAMTLIAGSLSAGHTFLRAIQMLCEESEPPLRDEFARVVHETQLGDSVVDALDRLAVRLQMRDLEWVVQAIRVQQTVGGKLADILHTLAEFMRAREDVRREVNVLTAEGRVSAWVLGGMPFIILVLISAGDPSYMKPMYRGWGYVWLAGTAISVLAGMGIILRMVKKIEI